MKRKKNAQLMQQAIQKVYNQRWRIGEKIYVTVNRYESRKKRDAKRWMK